MPARNKNPGKLLTAVYRGVIDLIPPEFRAKMGIRVDTTPGVNNDLNDVTPPALPIIAAQFEQGRTDERDLKVTKLLDPTAILVETYKNEDGQIATRTRSLVSEGTSITANALTVEGQQKDLGNGVLLQDKSVVPTVFGQNTYEATRRSFLPLEFASSVDEIENSVVVAGTAGAQTTSGVTVRNEEQQLDVFKKKVSSRTYADFLSVIIKDVITDLETGIPVSVTKQIVAVDTVTPGVQMDGSYVDLTGINKDYQIKITSKVALNQALLDAIAQSYDTTIDYRWPDLLEGIEYENSPGSETVTPTGSFQSRVTYGNGYTFNAEAAVLVKHGPFGQTPVNIVRQFFLVPPTIAPSDIFYWVLRSGALLIQGGSHSESTSIDDTSVGVGEIVSVADSSRYQAVGIPPVLTNGVTLSVAPSTGTAGLHLHINASSPTSYPNTNKVIRKTAQRWRLGLYIVDTVNLKPAPF